MLLLYLTFYFVDLIINLSGPRWFFAGVKDGKLFRKKFHMKTQILCYIKNSIGNKCWNDSEPYRYYFCRASW